jgi:glycosyltransferase involved in cell wall biosynthesis
MWATRAVRFIFGRPRPEAERERLLAALAAYRLDLKTPAGRRLGVRTWNRPRPDYDRVQAETLARVDHLLPNSYLEMDRLVKTLRIYRPFTAVPYAADPKLFLDPDPEPFVREHGLRDFVLQVGRIEPSKNQLMLCHALRNLDLPVVLIGGKHNPAYAELCRAHGPKHLVILPHLPPEMLRSAYAAARVHALPSWIETCGLVSLEAALAGCSIIVSTAGYELEYFRDLAEYCDPAVPASIRDRVVRALENYEGEAPRRERLRTLIRREYTWHRAAGLTLGAYLKALDRESSGA